MIKLGKITAPVGIKGEVRVFPYIDDISGIKKVKTVYIKDKAYPLEAARLQKNMLVMKMSGIDDRNASEEYRNAEISIAKEDMWELDEDTYLDDDIVGIEVIDESGSPVGHVSEITHGPVQDIYEITKPDGKSFLLPAVKAFVLDIDLDANKMTVRLIEGIDSL